MNKEFRHKKSLGQNFMMDSNVARKIVEKSGIKKVDEVLEIGPGTGFLTKEILKVAKKVTAVEIDERLVEYLQEEFADEERFEIIHHDFLTFDITGLAKKSNKKLKVIGNIPYHITSQILIHVFDHFRSVDTLTATLQKEVADRLLSPPGSKKYGILSVYTSLFSESEKLFNISRGVFNPKPKVESSAIKLTLRDELPDDIGDLNHLKRVIRTTFGKRRKMLRNSIKGVADCASFLEERGFDLTRRPESLDVQGFIDISNAVMEWTEKNINVDSATNLSS